MINDIKAFENLKASLHHHSAEPYAVTKIPRHKSIHQTTALESSHGALDVGLTSPFSEI